MILPTNSCIHDRWLYHITSCSEQCTSFCPQRFALCFIRLSISQPESRLPRKASRVFTSNYFSSSACSIESTIGRPSNPGRPRLHNSGRKNLELFARSMDDILHLPGPWAHDLIPWTAVVKLTCCAPSVRDPRSKLGLLRRDFCSESGDPNTVLKCTVWRTRER